MIKDIEWLKKEITDVIDYYYEYPFINGHTQGMINEIKKVMEQADEPEVLSQEWIDTHKKHGRVSSGIFGDSGLFSDYVLVKDLEKEALLVPKQEELEAKIQELIKVYKQEDGQHSNPENYWIDDFISNLERLLEEEKRYVVIDTKGSYILVKIKDEIMTMGEVLEFYGHESVDIDYNLTEQEIKDYDPRYMAFAKPVEELEE